MNKGPSSRRLTFLLANVKQRKVCELQPSTHRMQRKCSLVCGCRDYEGACHCDSPQSLCSPLPKLGNQAPWQGLLGGAGFCIPECTALAEVLPQSILVSGASYDLLKSFPNFLAACCHLHSSPLSAPVRSKDYFSLMFDPECCCH